MDDKEIEKQNEFIVMMESKGYRIWNDHPGYTIKSLNEMLACHELIIKTQMEDDNLWYRIESTSNQLNTLLAYLEEFDVVDLVNARFKERHNNPVPGILLQNQITKMRKTLEQF